MRQGIWIPSYIDGLENLCLNEKIILSEVSSLCENGKCFASNKHFARLLHLKDDTISRIISRLKKKGFLIQTGFDGRKRFLQVNLESLPNVNPTQHRKLDTGGKSNGARLETASNAELEKETNPLLYGTSTSTINVQMKNFEIKKQKFSKETQHWINQIFQSGGILPQDTPPHILQIWRALNSGSL